jgi:HD-GYP domain-containing protein (c-di-GMP phosphodiesterase class II)
VLFRSMNIVKMHAAAGADIVASIDFGGDIAEIIRQHHERLDGSGYPQGLRAEQIVPEARILAVADVVEAMLSHRPYRPALPLTDVLEELEAGVGSAYDAEVCSACTQLLCKEGFVFSE